jgi:hypothetical protein
VTNNCVSIRHSLVHVLELLSTRGLSGKGKLCQQISFNAECWLEIRRVSCTGSYFPPNRNDGQAMAEAERKLSATPAGAESGVYYRSALLHNLSM